jgi:hypothetical protein
MAWNVPKRRALAEGLTNSPLETLRELLTVRASGICDSTTLLRLAAKVFIASMVTVDGPFGHVSI